MYRLSAARFLSSISRTPTNQKFNHLIRHISSDKSPPPPNKTSSPSSKININHKRRIVPTFHKPEPDEYDQQSAEYNSIYSRLPVREFDPDVTLKYFESLYHGKPPKVRSNIENILLEYERQKFTECMDVPRTLTLANMRNLLTMYPDARQVVGHFHYLRARELAEMKDQRKKQALKAMKEERDQLRDKDWRLSIWKDKTETELEYGLWHNTLLTRITKSSIDNLRYTQAERLACQFGQKLIVDLDYDDYMVYAETKQLAFQLRQLYYDNLINRDFPGAIPFDVHFTNCGKAERSLDALKGQILRLDKIQPQFHPGSYLDRPDLFPREQLVYLSPHATDVLKDYHHDHIYIIGGYNDRITKTDISHIKATKEGVRTARLPLDLYVRWKRGNKKLCINHVRTMLQAVQMTGDWRGAIELAAPQRKVKTQEEMDEEDTVRAELMKKRVRDVRRHLTLPPK